MLKMILYYVLFVEGLSWRCQLTSYAMIDITDDSVKKDIDVMLWSMRLYSVRRYLKKRFLGERNSGGEIR